MVGTETERGYIPEGGVWVRDDEVANLSLNMTEKRELTLARKNAALLAALKEAHGQIEYLVGMFGQHPFPQDAEHREALIAEVEK